MKKRIILSSVLVMILCFCLIGGATFALFTSQSEVNIAVTRGKVKVEAKVDNLKVYSMDVEQTLEVESKKVFENGGTAQYVDGVLTLDRITPGDKVLFDIIVSNDSNIDIQYKVKWYKSGELMSSLKAYIINENNEEANLDNVAWTEWKADASEKKMTIKVGVELPITAGNEYQDKPAQIRFVVEAIQGNAADKGFVLGEEDLLEALANGQQYIILGDNIELNGTIDINYATTISGNGFTISRTDGFTGTMINVKTPTVSTLAEGAANLTLENVTLDGGAVWTGEVNQTLGRGTVNSGVVATGNLVAAEKNTSIVLGEGAVLQNNDGTHAVNLGTRIGATLTLNGGEIINNASGSGAIWGGGNITLNSGKISNNNSTSFAGAIRMVSNCNLTINGGEMNNNYAAGNGGAICGYGSSTYNFTGGSMSNNVSAGTGGAIYMGEYSITNMSGDFKLENNKAENSGAIRFTNYNTFNMTGGTVSGNTSNDGYAFNTWNVSIKLSGGELADKFSIVGGLGATFGKADITGQIYFDLSTNHNTAYLESEFNGFSFVVNENDEHFSVFNFKPAEGYTYVIGDEEKLVCMNEGYKTYWDEATSTFRLKVSE